MRQPRTTLVRLAAAALLVSAGSRGAGSPAAAGQAAGQAPPAVFGTEVVLVAVPVFVTDGSGRAVSGLTAEDFVVEDGGRVVPIRAFQAVDVREPLPESAELPTPVRAALPRQFLLLFDLQFSPFVGVQKARETSARFVREGLADGDLVAAATYGRHGFKMLTNFTTDREHVARAVEGMGYDAAQAEATDALGLTSGLTTPAPTGSDSGASGLIDQEIEEEMAVLTQAARQAYGRQFEDFVETLEELARAMARLSGRKQVILLSAGANESAWQGLASAGATSPASLVEHSARDAMARLFRAAGVHDVAIHAVNLAGLEGPVDVGSHSGQSAARRSGYDTLAALAENTGGRFVLPTNDFGHALREVEQASRRYYVLAFEPADPGGGRDRPRSLKVRVRREGLTLSHRAAYALAPAAPTSDPSQQRLAAAEAIAKGLSGGPLALDVVAAPYRGRDGKTSLPVALHVDGPALLSAARGPRLDVEVFGYAMAADRVLDRLAVKTTIDLAKREASVRSGGLSVATSFAVPPGTVDLRFLVRAGSEGRTGSIRRVVGVPAASADALSVSAPLVVRPLGDRMAFPAQTQARLGVPPFRVGGDILLPVRPALEPGETRELLAFVWRTEGAGRPLEVTGALARPGEEPIPLRVEAARVVPDADGVERCLVRVAAPAALAGDYALRLQFREPDTGRSARSETTVTLRR